MGRIADSKKPQSSGSQRLAGKADTGTGRTSVGSRASGIPVSASVVLVGAAELYAGGSDFAGLGKHPVGGIGT